MNKHTSTLVKYAHLCMDVCMHALVKGSPNEQTHLNVGKVCTPMYGCMYACLGKGLT